MKKMFLLLTMGLFIFSIAGASANAVIDTVINGHVYNNGAGVYNAYVNVICNHSNIATQKMTMTNSDGFYAVNFETNKCSDSDLVSVLAVKKGMHGSNNGTVQDGGVWGLPVDISNVNVNMVPEFGFFLGLLTLFSAVGIFFVVRKD